jgi:hypothetical protein
MASPVAIKSSVSLSFYTSVFDTSNTNTSPSNKQLNTQSNTSKTTPSNKQNNNPFNARL